MKVHRHPWTSTYGLGRSLLASSTLLTLALHPPDLVFRPLGSRALDPLPQTLLSRTSLFHLFPAEHLPIAQIAAVIVLTVVVSGWRPRWTVLPHWYVTYSYAAATAMPEGGDQLATILTLLLIPVGLTDPRRWHWQTFPALRGAARLARRIQAMLAASAIVMVRLQVAIVYLHAAVAKTDSQEWVNGTAVYYWFTHPVYGAADWLEPLLRPLLLWSPSVMALTWGTIALELLLFGALFMPTEARKWLLPVGIVFHAGIALIHGLVAFGFAMTGALVIYLLPTDRPLLRPRLPRLQIAAPDLDGSQEGLLHRLQSTRPAASRHARQSASG